MRVSDLSEVKLFKLPKFEDDRGNLSFIEGNSHVPFEISRAYFIYDVPGGELRGGHAFKHQEEFIIALSGSFEVRVSDSFTTISYLLNRSYNGLYIPCGLWRQMSDFSGNSMALVLSSTFYDEKDYIRDFQEFKFLRGNEKI